MNNSTTAAWNTFASRLEQYLRRRVHNYADVQDLLQEVFLKLHQQTERIEPKYLEGWLFRTARNAMIDRFRREQALSVVSVERLSFDLNNSQTTEELESRLGKWLIEQIDHLPPVYAEAVQKVDVRGVSQQDTATELGLPYSTLKSRVQRGREHLRQALGQCCLVERDARGRIQDIEPLKKCSSPSHKVSTSSFSKTSKKSISSQCCS